MQNKKKILISVTIIFIMIIGFFIYFNRTKETVLDTYILNQQGLMKNDKSILDEKFDEKGNLIYYKYKVSDDSEILEFNFDYEYDEQDRIVQVSLDDKEFIKIEYNENNQISKINESIMDVLSSNNTVIEYICDYLDNDEILVEKNMIYNYNTEEQYQEHFLLDFKTKTTNNADYVVLTEKDDDNNLVSEMSYIKGSQNIDYGNFYDLLNIIPLGYSTEEHIFKNTMSYANSLYMEPIFYNGNVIYLKNYIKQGYANIQEMKNNLYYDNMNRLLRFQTEGYETNSTINCMYESINSKEYYEYRLVKLYSQSSSKMTYIKNKIYLDDDDKVCKKEVMISNEIDEKEYDAKLKNFEKYFEKENIQL